MATCCSAIEVAGINLIPDAMAHELGLGRAGPGDAHFLTPDRSRAPFVFFEEGVRAFAWLPNLGFALPMLGMLPSCSPSCKSDILDRAFEVFMTAVKMV